MGMLSPIIERATNEVLAGIDFETTGKLLDALKSLGLLNNELSAWESTRRRTPPRKQFRYTSKPSYSGRRRNRQARRQDTAEETLRIARVVDQAIRVFGSEIKAIRWLRQANETLSDFRPIDLLKSETGAQAVEETLHRIDFGIYA